ncbi:MAG: tetratricopeptide repeat protein [Rhodanobacter sp.]
MGKLGVSCITGAWLMLSWTGVAVGQVTASSTVKPTRVELERVDALEDALLGVSDSHPDQRYRNAGIVAYKHGDKALALSLYIKAASYADKVSQAMVAMMYWNGDGIGADRPRAYAWMDLAADRGYRDLLAQREQYWQLLSKAEREQALVVGREIYADYSDEQGLDRLRLKLSRGMLSVTGSHTGFLVNGVSWLGDGSTGSLKDFSGTPVDFNRMFDPMLWNPEQYARLKDLQWELKRPLHGHVEVGDPQVVTKPVDDPDSGG